MSFPMTSFDFFLVFLCMLYLLVRYTFVRKTIRQVDLSATTGHVMSCVVEVIETNRRTDKRSNTEIHIHA